MWHSFIKFNARLVLTLSGTLPSLNIFLNVPAWYSFSFLKPWKPINQLIKHRYMPYSIFLYSPCHWVLQTTYHICQQKWFQLLIPGFYNSRLIHILGLEFFTLKEQITIACLQYCEDLNCNRIPSGCMYFM